MPSAGAIEAGQAFVKFYGDDSPLMASMKSTQKAMSSWSASISHEAKSSIGASFAESQKSAAKMVGEARKGADMVSASLRGIHTAGATAGHQINDVGIAMLNLNIDASAVNAVIHGVQALGIAFNNFTGKLVATYPWVAKLKIGFAYFSNLTTISRGVNLLGFALGQLSGFAKIAGGGMDVATGKAAAAKTGLAGAAASVSGFARKSTDAFLRLLLGAKALPAVEKPAMTTLDVLTAGVNTLAKSLAFKAKMISLATAPYRLLRTTAVGAFFGISLAIKGASLGITGMIGMAGRLGRSFGGLRSWLGGGVMRAASEHGGDRHESTMVSAVGKPVEDGSKHSVEQSTKTIGSLAAAFSMGGIVGAAAVGLGSLINTALTEGAKEGAENSTNSLTRMGNMIWGVVAWAGNAFEKLKATVIGAVAKVFPASKGPTLFDRVGKSLYPIVYAIENVFIPAIGSAIEWALGFFAKPVEAGKRAWSGFFVDTVGELAMFVANFDIYFQLLQQNIALFADNGLTMLSDLFDNGGKLLDWFGENWFNVLRDMTVGAATAWTNIGKNLGEIMYKVFEWVRSGFSESLKIDWTPLMDGFKASTKELPKVFTSRLKETTPEIAKLWKDIDKREAKIKEEGKGFGGFGAKFKDKVKDTDGKFAAVSAQSSEGAAARAMLQGGSPGKAADTTAKNTTKANMLLDRIAKERKIKLTKYILPGTS